MKKEDVTLIAQLVYSMEEAVKKMERAFVKKDFEALESSKREVLDFQRKIDSEL
jgi:hypothetical protein